MKDSPKQIGSGLEVNTLRGESGEVYLVFRSKEGHFHIFREVDGEEAANDCGAEVRPPGGRTWESIWHRLKAE